MFFFRKRLKRILNVEEIEKRAKEEGPPDIEKGDLPAMIIAAFIVFTPCILLIVAVVWLLSLLFLPG